MCRFFIKLEKPHFRPILGPFSPINPKLDVFQKIPIIVFFLILLVLQKSDQTSAENVVTKLLLDASCIAQTSMPFSCLSITLLVLCMLIENWKTKLLNIPEEVESRQYGPQICVFTSLNRGTFQFIFKKEATSAKRGKCAVEF